MQHASVLLRARRVYFVEGVGQCIEDIVEFFPEMKPHMPRHMEDAIAEDLAWLTRPFTRSREVPGAALEKGWS